MNWENTFQRLKRIIEVQNGVYCEHLPLFINKDNTVVNRDNKTVCKKCCDHYDCETYINKKFEKVCILCCQHKIYTKEPFCEVCFSVVPQTIVPPINNSVCAWRYRIATQMEKKEKRKIKIKNKNFQTKSELVSIAKSLNLKKFWKLNKADLKVFIENHKSQSQCL